MTKCFGTTNSFWIDPQGDVRPCARHKSKVAHVSEFDDFTKINNSSYFKEITKKLENNKWPDGCIRCKQDESKGLHSKRQFYEDLDLDTEKDFMIDISMGNYCNLKCRMCGPHNSTQWIKDYNSLIKKKIIPDLGLETQPYTLSSIDIEKLKTLIADKQGRVFIELKGGEPLIMPETHMLIKELSELPNSNQIELLIVTNGTVCPEWLSNLYKNFLKIFLVVSIDGLNEVYDYIRSNKKYSYKNCIENIEKFIHFENINLSFNVVVQNLNIHQLPRIHKKLTKYSNKINYITLSMPVYLQPNVMPENSRKKILHTIHKNIDVFGDHEKSILQIAQTLNEKPDKKIYEKFIEISTELDRNRNLSLQNTLPHLL
jgi:radical SAM protein with 4Fe4S-binding SPASM domain